MEPGITCRSGIDKLGLMQTLQLIGLKLVRCQMKNMIMSMISGLVE